MNITGNSRSFSLKRISVQAIRPETGLQVVTKMKTYQSWLIRLRKSKQKSRATSKKILVAPLLNK